MLTTKLLENDLKICWPHDLWWSADGLVPINLLCFIGSDSEDNESLGDAEDEGEIADGPPPLKSDDHYHVFFYHSANSEDQDQIEHYMSMIENRSVPLFAG